MAKNSIVTGALILTAASVITRILGFVYRIYMSNVMGAEGMGLYQLILPIYTLAWSIACSGFTTTVSKLTAQELAKGEHGNMRRILKQSVCITTSIGLVLSVLLYFYAGWIAQVFFKEPRITLALQILAFSIPFMSAGGCIAELVLLGRYFLQKMQCVNGCGKTRIGYGLNDNFFNFCRG